MKLRFQFAKYLRQSISSIEDASPKLNLFSKLLMMVCVLISLILVTLWYLVAKSNESEKFYVSSKDLE